MLNVWEHLQHSSLWLKLTRSTLRGDASLAPNYLSQSALHLFDGLDVILRICFGNCIYAFYKTSFKAFKGNAKTAI